MFFVFVLGWWNAYLSIEFLRFHFADRSDIANPVLLLWDDFSGHWTREVTEYAASINVALLKVPASATSVCQPADVAWNKPLKENLRKCWVDSLRKQLSQRREGQPFKLVPPTRADICEWVSRAWKSLSSDIIESGFRRASIIPCETEVDNQLMQELEDLHLVDAGVCSDDEAEFADQ